jgi:hypothetical protein
MAAWRQRLSRCPHSHPGTRDLMPSRESRFETCRSLPLAVSVGIQADDRSNQQIRESITEPGSKKMPMIRDSSQPGESMERKRFNSCDVDDGYRLDQAFRMQRRGRSTRNFPGFAGKWLPLSLGEVKSRLAFSVSVVSKFEIVGSLPVRIVKEPFACGHF